MTASRRPSEPQARTGEDGRLWLAQADTGSPAAHTTASRQGCRLTGVPAACLGEYAGTVTLEEYRAWAARCEPCELGNHTGTNGTPGCTGAACSCPCAPTPTEGPR